MSTHVHTVYISTPNEALLTVIHYTPRSKSNAARRGERRCAWHRYRSVDGL